MSFYKDAGIILKNKSYEEQLGFSLEKRRLGEVLLYFTHRVSPSCGKDRNTSLSPEVHLDCNEVSPSTTILP